MTESEAYQTLLARASRRTGVVPPESVVHHVLRLRVVVTGPSTATAVDIQRLVSGRIIQRTAAGGLVVEAPPETASTLAALFSGMAQLFQAAVAPTVTGEDPTGRR